MARVVQTTDEKVLKAAKDFPKAEGLLKDLFPEVFKPEFKAGDIVDYKTGHCNAPFVVLNFSASAMVRREYNLPEGLVHLISLQDGSSYSVKPETLVLVREKY